MRRSLTVIASILAGCLIIGFLFSRVTVSQVAPAVPPLPTAGRFQVAIGVDSSPGGGRTVVVCDTVTGRCWVDASGGRGKTAWRDLGTPTAVKSEATD